MISDSFAGVVVESYRCRWARRIPLTDKTRANQASPEVGHPVNYSRLRRSVLAETRPILCGTEVVGPKIRGSRSSGPGGVVITICSVALHVVLLDHVSAGHPSVLEGYLDPALHVVFSPVVRHGIVVRAIAEADPAKLEAGRLVALHG